VIAAARLRKGSTNSARGAGRFVTDALATAKKAGASGVLVLRADSAYYGHDVIAAAARHRARFSITARQDKAVRTAIATIAEDAWTTIKYTNAVFDEDQQRWISDAEVAEINYTAFTSKPKAQHVHARLLVRRVKDMNPNHQSELFTAYRYQLSRPGARCRCCRRSVSPGRSPNPPCGSLRNGLSTVSAIRVGWAGARG